MLKCISNITNIIFPKSCPGCSGYITTEEGLLCIACRHALQLTDFHLQPENIMARTLYAQCNLNHAIAMFIYQKEGIVQHMIHQLKYNGQDHIGKQLGTWYGAVLNDAGYSKKYDLVIPVPIHPRKKRIRGYNQVTGFATAMAEQLQIPYQENVLIRTRYTKTQTFKNRVLRQYTNQIFAVNPMVKITKKHILLVDDVVTTGATIGQCAKLLATLPEVKVSVAAIAFTE